MREYSKGVWVVLFILLASNVYAIEVSNLTFYRYGKEVTMVSPGNPRMSDLDFMIDETFERVEVDSTELFPTNRISTLTPSDCQAVESGLLCRVGNVVLMPETSSGNVHFDIYHDGSFDEQDLPFSFEIDDISPTVVSITTEGCQDPCYIGNPRKEIIFQLQDSKGNLDAGQVFYQIGGEIARMVDYCEGMTCYSYEGVNCQNGEDVVVKVTTSADGVPSRDDAGNPIDDFEAAFVCDREKPEITDLRVDTEDGNIVQGSNVKIIVTARDAVSLRASADLTRLSGATEEVSCVEIDDHQKCVFDVVATAEGYNKFDIDVKVFDQAGNEETRTETIEVLTSVSGEKDLVRVRSVNYQPRSLNGRILRYTGEKKVYAFLNIEGLGNARSSKVDITTCTGESNSLAEANINNLNPESPYLELEISKAVLNEGVDDFDIECNLSISVRTRTASYVEPETEQVKLNFRIVEGLSVSESIEEELDAFRENDKTLKTIIDYLGVFNRVVTNMCNFGQIVNYAAGAVTTAEAAVCAIPVAGELLSKPLGTVTDSLGHLSNTINSKGNPFYKFCDVFTCKRSVLPGVQKVAESITKYCGVGFLEDLSEGAEGEATNEGGVADYAFLGLTKQDLFRPQDSLIWSAATGCMSGVIYNLEKWRQIDCEYERCLVENAQTGTVPMQACSDTRDYASCKYKSGQLVNVCPLTSVLNSYGNVLASVFSDPFAMASVIINLKYKCPPALECGIHVACTVPSTFASAAQITGLVNSIGDAIDSFKNLASAISGDESIEQAPCKYLENLTAPPFYDPFVPQAGVRCDAQGCANSQGIVYRGEGNPGALQVRNIEGRQYTYRGGTYYRVTQTSTGISMTELVDDEEDAIKEAFDSEAATSQLLSFPPGGDDGPMLSITTFDDDETKTKEINVQEEYEAIVSNIERDGFLQLTDRQRNDILGNLDTLSEAEVDLAAMAELEGKLNAYDALHADYLAAFSGVDGSDLANAGYLDQQREEMSIVLREINELGERYGISVPEISLRARDTRFTGVANVRTAMNAYNDLFEQYRDSDYGSYEERQAAWENVLAARETANNAIGQANEGRQDFQIGEIPDPETLLYPPQEASSSQAAAGATSVQGARSVAGTASIAWNIPEVESGNLDDIINYYNNKNTQFEGVGAMHQLAFDNPNADESIRRAAGLSVRRAEMIASRSAELGLALSEARAAQERGDLEQARQHMLAAQNLRAEVQFMEDLRRNTMDSMNRADLRHLLPREQQRGPQEVGPDIRLADLDMDDDTTNFFSELSLATAVVAVPGAAVNAQQRGALEMLLRSAAQKSASTGVPSVANAAQQGVVESMLRRGGMSTRQAAEEAAKLAGRSKDEVAAAGRRAVESGARMYSSATQESARSSLRSIAGRLGLRIRDGLSTAWAHVPKNPTLLQVGRLARAATVVSSLGFYDLAGTTLGIMYYTNKASSQELRGAEADLARITTLQDTALNTEEAILAALESGGLAIVEIPLPEEEIGVSQAGLSFASSVDETTPAEPALSGEWEITGEPESTTSPAGEEDPEGPVAEEAPEVPVCREELCESGVVGVVVVACGEVNDPESCEFVLLTGELDVGGGCEDGSDECTSGTGAAFGNFKGNIGRMHSAFAACNAEADPESCIAEYVESHDYDLETIRAACTNRANADTVECIRIMAELEKLEARQALEKMAAWNNLPFHQRLGASTRYAMSVHRGIRKVSDWIGTDLYFRDVEDFFNDLFNVEERVDVLSCKSRFDKNDQTTSVFSTSQFGLSAASSIQGFRDRPTKVNDTYYTYDYLVTASLQPPSTGSFDVKLIAVGREELDLTEKVTMDPASEPLLIPVNNPIVFTSDKLYNFVCLEFEPLPEDDAYTEIFINNNRICNVIV